MKTKIIWKLTFIFYYIEEHVSELVNELTHSLTHDSFAQKNWIISLWLLCSLCTNLFILLFLNQLLSLLSSSIKLPCGGKACVMEKN